MGRTTAWHELLETFPEEDHRALNKMASGGGLGIWGLGARPAVLVVDMTRAFVSDAYPTGWSETGEPCVRAISRLLAEVRPWGVPIIYTTGIITSKEAEIGAWFRGGDVSKGRFPYTGPPESNEIPDALAPGPDDVVIPKGKPSAFFGTQLASILNYQRIDSLVVTGMVTSGCIRATVNDAFALNYRVVIPVECVADRCQLSHRVELVDMGAKYADIVRLDEVLEDGDLRESLRGWSASSPTPA